MDNQASEKELHELLIKKLNTKKRMIEPHDERFVIGFQTEAPGDDVDWQYLDEVIMRYVGDFIRTEKLKLLAEIRERVVGEPVPYDWDDDIDDMTKWKYYTGYKSNADDFVAGYNRSRAERLEQLVKLEAEL